MTIVATREGTSVQVIENDEGYMSEVLYFNEKGERAPFTATRLSDFKAQGGDKTTPGHAASAEAGLNVVMVIQVPLKHKAQQRFAQPFMMMEDAAEMAAPTASAKSVGPTSKSQSLVMAKPRVRSRRSTISSLSATNDSPSGSQRSSTKPPRTAW